MMEIRDQLGKLYDTLAGIQADAKVGNMSEAHFGFHILKILDFSFAT